MSSHVYHIHYIPILVQVASNFLQDAVLHDNIKWKAQTRMSIDAHAHANVVVDAFSFWDTFVTGGKRVNNEVLTITDVDVNEVYTLVKKVRLYRFFFFFSPLDP